MICFSKSRGKTYNPKLDLTETVIIAQRYNVSERAVAYITSAVLHAALKAVITSSGQSSDITSALIVDKNKIRRGKLKVARNLKQRSTDDDPIKSLYFDGRKDETKTQTGIFREENISLVSEPNSQYVGHVTPSSASAHDETTVIFEYITSQLKGAFDEVDVLGCDGRNTNYWLEGRYSSKIRGINRQAYAVGCLPFAFHRTTVPSSLYSY
ncbi:hypothetical protein AVEN_218705-1 [Araneus ventricosus]|uniref:Uncharacterized protein n=1 Tax=Araneus ventricosus TaxID=182803 RepID=A0A4Y2B3R3_ARAVE|nr:hypothetical protein AVEN_218705-1 [Araneus ventricosus]